MPKKVENSISRISTTQKITPIEIFKRAITRSEAFISGGKDNKGRRDTDDLRAATVFAVASIDAFFRAKIIYVLRKKQLTKNFLLPDSTRKVIQKIISKKLFTGKEYSQLTPDQKKAVNAMCESQKTYLISYLQKALTEMSFQNINQLDEGIKMMGEKPQEIWAKILNMGNGSASRKVGPGRPKKKQKGPKTDDKVQLRNLFLRRHKIVHEADLNLQSKKHRGQERKILYNIVNPVRKDRVKALSFLTGFTFYSPDDRLGSRIRFLGLPRSLRSLAMT